MNAVKIPQSNAFLHAPGCNDLPCVRTTTQNGDPLFVTAWKPTEEEVKRLIAGDGYIYLLVLGDQHPPVSLAVDSPFIPQILTSPGVPNT